MAALPWGQMAWGQAVWYVNKAHKLFLLLNHYCTCFQKVEKSVISVYASQIARLSQKPDRKQELLQYCPYYLSLRKQGWSPNENAN